MTREEIARAKETDLLTYLQRYEPDELVRCGRGYRTRTHDSLKISNGLWHWHSRGIGGKTALDYLIHVRGMDFVSAVRLLSDSTAAQPSCETATQPSCETTAPPQEASHRPFTLPEKNRDNITVIAYLTRRGIDFNVIARCLENGTLFESKDYHNAVFVGKDVSGIPRYAMLRATDGRNLKMEANGSDKRFSFSMRGKSDALLVTESAIDALSVATIRRKNGQPWRLPHYLSLGGISNKQSNVPMALRQYLTDHPEIMRICLMLDNDRAGKTAARHIMEKLTGKYDICALFPSHGKDFNDEAQYIASEKVSEIKRRSR